MRAGFRGTRSLAIALAILGQTFGASWPAVHPSGVGDRAGASPGRAQPWPLAPGSPAPHVDESSPAESDGPAADGEDAPCDADRPSQKAEPAARRRSAWRLPIGAGRRAEPSRPGRLAGVGGPRTPGDASSAGTSLGLPVFLRRLTC